MTQFSNQASLSYEGQTTLSNIVVGEILQPINAWKDATYDLYRPGDILTYVVSLQNSGGSTLTGLTITDNLGAYPFGGGSVVPLSYTGDPILYYINGILQNAPGAVAGPPLVIGGISVLTGLSTIVIYRVRVNGYAPLGAGGQIVNTASISGGGLSSAITATETVTPDLAADLSLVKALSPGVVVQNGQIEYSFTLENTGATAVSAAAKLVIADTFAPALQAPVSVTLNGAPWPQAGNYSYDAATGAFATVAGSVSVPAAAFAQDAATGLWTIAPGVTTLSVSGML